MSNGNPRLCMFHLNEDFDNIFGKFASSLHMYGLQMISHVFFTTMSSSSFCMPHSKTARITSQSNMSTIFSTYQNEAIVNTSNASYSQSNLTAISVS